MTELHNCQRCARLTDYRTEQKLRFPHYHCLPVAGIGPDDANLLIVGLAPGLHGANASGRPFTGDASGDMLFATLTRYGYATPEIKSTSIDKVQLVNCRITNAVKCVPPQNRPLGAEIRHCNDYLRQEISSLPAASVIIALGTIAHNSILKALGIQLSRMRFAHLAEHRIDENLILVDSYHCSRYNINTGRLNQAGFDAVFKRIQQLLA